MNMMEELKLLGELVAGLPNLALWVIVMLFAYKVAVVGSVYGVIRFTVGKVIEWALAKKAAPVEYKEIRPMLDGVVIRGHVDELIAQVLRCRNRECDNQSEYVHIGDINWLRRAIDAQIAADAEKEKGRKVAS